jgi:putative flippase GtrA
MLQRYTMRKSVASRLQELRAPLLLTQFFRFGLVGIVNTAIDFSVFMLLYSGIGLDPIVANIIAFAVAVTNSYFMNLSWTFRQQKDSISLSNMIQFVLVNSGGLLITIAILVLLNGMVAVPVAKLTAILATLIWNFTFSKLIIFSNLS